MKLHLPKTLMVAVLAAAAGVASATMTAPTQGREGHIWTWDGNTWTKDDNTQSDPKRDGNVGAFVIFEADKMSQTLGVTSDGGGALVKENVNVSDISLGNWGGTIQVEAGAYLDAWAAQLKSEVIDDTTANVWVDGILNLRGFSKYDGGANQKWHIGENGKIILPQTESLNENGKQWHIELVQSVNEEVIAGLTNRSQSAFTKTRTYLESKGKLSEWLDSLTVMDVNGNILVKDTDYTISNTDNSLGISCNFFGYANTELTWNGVDGSKWEHTGDAWVDAEGKVTSFINGDSVVFATITDGVSDTVLLSGNLSVGKMEIKDDYSFVVDENVTLTADSITVTSGKTFSKAGSAELTIQGSIAGNVEVTAGTLAVAGGEAIKGDKLDISNGKVVATLVGNGETVIAHKTQVNVGTGGTLELNGHDMLGWGRDSAPSIVLGSTDASKTAKLFVNDTVSCTFAASVTMNGNSEIGGGKLNTFFVPKEEEGVNNTALTVSGKNNKITLSELQIRSTQNNIKTWNVEVAESGELTIDSIVKNHSDGTSEITKLGKGQLTFTHAESDWNSTLNVTEGSVKLKDSASLKNASIVVSSGSSVDLGSGSVKNLTLMDGSSLVLNAYGESAVSVTGKLELGTNLTLDASTIQKLMGLANNESLIIFQSVSDFMLGKVEDQLATANTTTESNGVDAGTYFKNIGTNTYYLNFNEGMVSITKQVPEPTTATLSLLALAALAARRRRK